jgi:isopentenyl-diphosphate delta-isomerase
MEILPEISLFHVGSKKQIAKLKHIDACLLPESQYQKNAGFHAIDLPHETAAGLSLDDISLATSFLGHSIRAPLMIAPMTGGTQRGAVLNQLWALAAEHFGVPFAVGSQRLALEDERVKQSFKVRQYAKTTLIFANLGAAQIVKEGPQQAMRAVEMIEADALFIHLNPLQEACQKDGDVNFTGVLNAIADVVKVLHERRIPVLVREVGFGLSERATKALIATGVAGLDCAGAGGTSWAKVEALCATDEKYRRLGNTFGEWGIPTVQSIKNVRKVDKNIPLIATGGIRTGIDIAKALVLGANLAGMAQPMLCAAIKGEHELMSFIEQILHELRVTLFAAGIRAVP